MTPAELSIFKSLFESVAEEMGVVLKRSSFSPNIKERRDFSCGLFDKEQALIAQAAHIPVHLGSMPHSVKAVAETKSLDPGDTIVLNDPFQGGTHLPDITLVQGLFANDSDELLGYLACRAHHSDVGGMAPGSMPLSTEIYQEGLIIPPTVLVKSGQQNDDVLNLILANVRTREERRGDLLAQLAALSRGQTRYQELVARYGKSELARAKKSLLLYTETLLKSKIRTWQKGRYTFEDTLELPAGETATIQLTLTVSEDKLNFDFTKSSRQVIHNANAVFAITESAVFYVLLGLVTMPANSGCLRSVTIQTKKGTIVDAVHPAPVAAGNVETSQRLVDVILGAFYQADPTLIPAASQGTMNNLSFGGYTEAGAFAYYETIPGGAGASRSGPGESVVQCHMTNTRNTPVEVLENDLPILVHQNRIATDTGGGGEFRGGDGLVREIEFLAPAKANILSTRRLTVPYGLAGGDAAKSGENSLLRQGGKWQTLDGGYAKLKLNPGDRLRITTPGGGGYGKPKA